METYEETMEDGSRVELLGYWGDDGWNVVAKRDDVDDNPDELDEPDEMEQC